MDLDIVGVEIRKVIKITTKAVKKALKDIAKAHRDNDRQYDKRTDELLKLEKEIQKQCPHEDVEERRWSGHGYSNIADITCKVCGANTYGTDKLP